MDTGIGRELTEIASLMIGVALVALLVGHASETVKIISAGTSGFNTLLQTITLSNSSPIPSMQTSLF